MLQEGIEYKGGGKPPCYRLMQLNIQRGAASHEVRSALTEIWAMLQRLKRGEVSDLRKELRTGDPDVVMPSGNLSALIGFGARLFDEDIHNPPMTDRANQPRRLKYLRSKSTSAPFNRLKWMDPHDPMLDPNHDFSSQSDICIQFLGDNELTVNRAVVETEKSINDISAPFYISGLFDGFKREDKRSWIDFHDGINNMTPANRLIAMEIKGGDREWLRNGTYMSFLKIHVDLKAWRSLPRHVQELIVGRDKITACPIVDSSSDLVGGFKTPVFQSGCPATHTLPNQMDPAFQAPPQPSDAIAQAGHIYRSNLNRGSPVQSANNRIYRQGYEFLEFDSDKRQLLNGLNFVGFHRTPKFVTDILGQAFWLGDSNFGGLEGTTPSNPPSIDLMLLLHGCYYGVPKSADPFPGAELFEDRASILVASAAPASSAATSPVTAVNGIGDAYATELGGLGINSVADLASIDLDAHRTPTGELPRILELAKKRGWVESAKVLV